jgi:isopentenyl-diphosphate Delta-isomerase
LPNSELVDVVDENDMVVETRSLDDCLRFGLLHRSITVFLRNSKGEIYIQQRSFRDNWLPGKWTASCTGHVKSGEEAYDAAERELEEELDVKAGPRYLFKFIVPSIRFRKFVEREWDIVFDVTCDDLVNINPHEVEQGKFISLKECRNFFESRPDDVCLDARLAFQKYLERLEPLGK